MKKNTSLKTISIRLCDDDYHVLQRVANLSNQPVSAIIRASIKEALSMTSSEMAADYIDKGTRTVAGRISSDDRTAIQEVAEKLHIPRGKWIALAVRSYCTLKIQVLTQHEKRSTWDTVDGFFNKEALQAQGFSYRRNQHVLSIAMHNHLEGSRIGVCEAGTGTGKAYAALAAAATFALNHETQVVISTYTNNLQNQLLNTVPMLSKVGGIHIDAAVLYGKRNYVSKRKINELIEQHHELTDKVTQKLKQWVAHTEHWLISELVEPLNDEFPVSMLCIDDHCTDEDELFAYRKAKEAASRADIVILSHHMLFLSKLHSDNQTSISMEHLIIDEAHLLDQAADSILNSELSFQSLVWSAENLLGIAGKHKKATQQWLQDIRFFTQAIQDSKGNDSDYIKLCSNAETHPAVSSNLSLLQRLAKPIRVSVQNRKKMTTLQASALQAVRDGCSVFKELLQRIDNHHAYGQTVYATLSPIKNNVRLLSFSNAFIAAKLGYVLWDKVQAASLLSATVFIPEKYGNSAKFFLNSLGLSKRDIDVEEQFFEPWVYENLTVNIASENMPIPSSDMNEHSSRHVWLDEIAALTMTLDEHAVSDTHGGIMILCTSYQDAEDVASRLKLRNRSLIVFRKGDNMKGTIDQFRKANGCAVLIALGGFWTGLDLQGRLLTDLVITRLPLNTSSNKLIMSRFDYIAEKSGVGTAFASTIIPRMLIALKQGMGRVIRHPDDVGRVYLMDSRIVVKKRWRVMSVLRPYEPVSKLECKFSSKGDKES